MEVLALFKNLVYNCAQSSKFESEEEVFSRWATSSYSEELKLLGLVSIPRTGHKYKIECTEAEVGTELFTLCIFVYSKKQANFVTELLKEGFLNMYNIKTTKIY